MLGCRKRGRAVLKWGGRRCDTGSGEFYIMYKGDDSVSLVTDAENSKKDFASLSPILSIITLVTLPGGGRNSRSQDRISFFLVDAKRAEWTFIHGTTTREPALYEQTAEVEDDPRISTDHLTIAIHPSAIMSLTGRWVRLVLLISQTVETLDKW